MATVRHRRWWASTARLWPRRSGSAARGTEREQILVVDVADASFMMPLSMEETPPAPPSTGMGSSARSCGRPRLPSSGDRGRSDCPSCRSRGNACCAAGPRSMHAQVPRGMGMHTKYGRIYVICCQDDMRRSVPHSEAHDATAAARYPMLNERPHPRCG